MKRVIKLDIDEVKPWMRHAPSICTGSRTVLLEAGKSITADHIRRLRNYAIRTIIVEDETIEEPRETPFTEKEVEENYFSRLKFILRHLPPKAGIEMTRAQIQSEKILDQTFQNSHLGLNEMIREAFEDIIHREKFEVNGFRKVLVSLIDELKEEMNIRQWQTRLSQEDDYLYMHSVNVTVYSLIVGMSLKLASEELIELGISALLHDIGMMKVPDKIRMKKEKLDRDEYQEVKQHSHHGKEFLEKFPQISPRILRAITHHHERVDGSGYPNGLSRDEINLFAKIISICDNFDSLSSPRPHRKAMKKHEALRKCMEMCEDNFDEHYLEKFLFNVPLYPVGTHVRLNNGEEGFVSQATFNPFRPCVDITKDKERQPLPRKRRVNLALARNSAFEIKDVLEHAHEEPVFS